MVRANKLLFDFRMHVGSAVSEKFFSPVFVILGSIAGAISSPEFSGSSVSGGSPGRTLGTRKKYDFFDWLSVKQWLRRKPVVPEIFQKGYLFSLAVAHKRKST